MSFQTAQREREAAESRERAQAMADALVAAERAREQCSTLCHPAEPCSITADGRCGAMRATLRAWVPVSERMPSSGHEVLACYRNSAGKRRLIRARWVAAKSWESGSESDLGEYDEASDTYYDPEGWYEQIDNWPEYTACAVTEGVVSYWREMPDFPEAAA